MAVPAAPTALVATPTQTSASIAFTQAAATPAVTNYEVKIGTGAWTPLAPADDASPITVSGLTNGKNYTIGLRAVNADGVSPQASVKVTTVDNPADNQDGFNLPSPFANAGRALKNLDWNDPDD